MKTILYMAISVNGIIARENNKEDFLSEGNWQTLVDLTNKAGCVIWGRKTHQIVKGWGGHYLESLKGVKKIIVSKDQNLDLEGDVLANSPQEALNKAAELGFTEVILSGGASLNSSFAKEGLIDEIIMNIDSVILGKGIPLFSPEEFDLKLELLEVNKLNQNIVQLHYKVKK